MRLLPDFLLRLSDPGPSGRRSSQSLWVRSSRGAGAYEAERSTVGAEYEFDRVDAEAGVTISLAKNVEAWFAAHYLTASANVSAATGGGGITVKGLGPSLGVSVGRASNYYALVRTIH